MFYMNMMALSVLKIETNCETAINLVVTFLMGNNPHLFCQKERENIHGFTKIGTVCLCTTTTLLNEK